MAQRRKIAVVEDEPDIRETLLYALEREGYEVVSAPDGERALELVRREKPDLVLLDLLLPGFDGIEVCRRMREDEATRQIPVIMVTAKDEESDVVLGLGVGADDYVTKPFSPKELVARVRAVLRRVRVPEEVPDNEILRRGELTIDPTRHEVRLGSETVPLTRTEFRLLQLLASRPGRVFSRDQIVSRVMGEGTSVIDRSVDVHVRAVRKKLGERRELIETVRGVGYRFVEEEAGTGASEER